MIMEAFLGNFVEIDSNMSLHPLVLLERCNSERSARSPVDFERRPGLELIVQNPRFWQTQCERTATSSLQFSDIVITWAECHGFVKI